MHHHNSIISVFQHEAVWRQPHQEFFHLFITFLGRWAFLILPEVIIIIPHLLIHFLPLNWLLSILNALWFCCWWSILFALWLSLLLTLSLVQLYSVFHDGLSHFHDYSFYLLLIDIGFNFGFLWLQVLLEFPLLIVVLSLWLVVFLLFIYLLILFDVGIWRILFCFLRLYLVTDYVLFLGGWMVGCWDLLIFPIELFFIVLWIWLRLILFFFVSLWLGMLLGFRWFLCLGCFRNGFIPISEIVIICHGGWWVGFHEII